MFGKYKSLFGKKPGFKSSYDAVIIGGGLHVLVLIFGMGVLLLHLRDLYLNRQGPTDTPMAEPDALAAG